MTLMPTNQAAQEIKRLQSINLDIVEQVCTLNETIESNNQIIAALDLIATWEEVELETDPTFAEE